MAAVDNMIHYDLASLAALAGEWTAGREWAVATFAALGAVALALSLVNGSRR
jgi:hypothetical protein